MAAYHLAASGMQPPNVPSTSNPQNPPNPPLQGSSYPGFQDKPSEFFGRTPSLSGPGDDLKRLQSQPEGGAEKRQKLYHQGGSGSSGLGSDADRMAVSDGGLGRHQKLDPWQARGAESAREGGGDAIEWDGTSTGTKRGARNKGTVEPLFPHVSILPVPKPAFKKPPPLVLLRDGTTVELKKLSPATRRELKKERGAHRNMVGGWREEATKGGGAASHAAGPSEGAAAGPGKGFSRGLEVSQSPKSTSDEEASKGRVQEGVQGLDDISVPSESEAPTVINEESQAAAPRVMPTVSTIGQSYRGDGSGSDSTVAGGRTQEAGAAAVPASRLSEGAQITRMSNEEARGGTSCGTVSGWPEGRKDHDQDEDDKGAHARRPPSGFARQAVAIGARETTRGRGESPKEGGGTGSGSGSERSLGGKLQHGMMKMGFYPSKSAFTKRKGGHPKLGPRRPACKKVVSEVVGFCATRPPTTQRVHAWGVPLKKAGCAMRASSWIKSAPGMLTKAQ
jgi:hypothetical protein